LEHLRARERDARALESRSGYWGAAEVRGKRPEEAGLTGWMAIWGPATGVLTSLSKWWSAVGSVRMDFDAAAGMTVGVAIVAASFSDADCRSRGEKTKIGGVDT
jgi:hypothetical protein